MEEHQKEQELDEERRIKAVMMRFAEWEGRQLWRENQAMSQDPFYQPSESSRKMFLKQVERHFEFRL